MLQGYRTYITIAVMSLYNILRAAGVDFGGITDKDIDAAVNVLLGVIAAIFNYVGRKRIATQK